MTMAADRAEDDRTLDELRLALAPEIARAAVFDGWTDGALPFSKAKESGMDQQMGPLNPYERRIVHLAIAEDPAVSSESIGDAFMKTVIISAKR